MFAICVILSYQISGIYRQYSKDWYNYALNRCVVFIWWLLWKKKILFNKYPLVQHPHGHHTFALVISIPVVISYENDSWKCNQSGRKQKRNLYLNESNIINFFLSTVLLHLDRREVNLWKHLIMDNWGKSYLLHQTFCTALVPRKHF